MAFYENTLVVRQSLGEKDLVSLKDKYDQIINNSSGKVVKIEQWGLLNLATKIKKNNKGFFIHYKFEGNKATLNEINKNIKIDRNIIRHLLVKFKKLDLEKKFFGK